MLKHYRSTHSRLLETFNCVYIDIDFSENLTIPIKYEPQSLHWYKEQVSLPTGMIRPSFAGHGKGEVGHVGGVAKICIHREIAAGNFFSCANEMVEFLNNKFKDHSSPNYVIKNIDGKQLEDDRSALKLKSFQTIEGSSKFQTMIFNPNSDYLKGAPWMCFCENCQTEYGSCDLFLPYELSIQVINQVFLRSDIPEATAPQ